MTAKPTTRATKASPPRRRWFTRRWVLYLLLALGIPAICLSAVLGYYYVVFSRLVDTQLHGERERVLPRVFARPLELRAGQHLNERQLIDRLNDLGYAERATAEHPGEFAITREGISLVPRTGRAAGRTVRAVFRGTPAVVAAGSARTTGGGRLDRLEMAGTGRLSALTLDAPLLTALIAEGRQKRRQVPLKMIPKHLVNAVLAIEDKRFYYHPGVDAIGAFGALVTNIKGDHPYLAGGSTITQQLVRNVFLGSFLANPLEKSLRRKLLEQWMAVVLERRASKDEVLELYLNEVYLGQRGSFAIHGVAEAARLFFGKDVANLTLAEAATIAGVIQSPHAHSPFASAARARPRRNVVLGAMADAGFITKQAADQAGREPLSVVSRALEAEAPYFVDLVGQTLSQSYPALVRTPQSIDVYTTLDLHLQRLAQDAVRDGLAQVDALLARRSRRTGPAQAALIAVDPRTGEILALVGGRSYNQSQYNRATVARRQPGSVFKPFVYLAAFERAAAEGRTDITPATVVNDEPTTFYYEDKEWSPGNYQNEYEGWITLREALAHSRNAATAKVAEMIGFDQVAALWNRVGTATPPKPYPSIALGVFEATPLEVATAYTIFPALGELRAFQSILRIMSGEREIVGGLARATKHIARPETTFLVLNMMRSVINEGTGAGARAAGFTLDAAGKTGTTNDLRDAWFAGFTPELLTVVWVGFDDNQALGLSGSQAALPIWSAFMIRALAGHANAAFEVPDGITFVEIDRDTGKLALPGCPRVVREAFVSGTEPTESCDLHRQ